MKKNRIKNLLGFLVIPYNYVIFNPKLSTTPNLSDHFPSIVEKKKPMINEVIPYKTPLF